MDSTEIKEMVRNRYGSIAAAASSSCCAPASASACCSPERSKASLMGYTEAELQAVPEGANLGLGCGNPQAIAALQPGEVLSTWAVAPASIACWPRGRSGREAA